MRLPGVSRRKNAEREARIALRLQSLRFRRMIETVRAFSALLEDGREKMGGEYILDRHYVESLAEELIERAGSIVFDACVLVAEGGEDLYAQYDSFRAGVRSMLVAGDAPELSLPDTKESGDEDLEPEYRLLSWILEWVDGQKTDSRETLMGFIRRVLDHVVTGIKELPPDDMKAETIDCTTPVAPNSIRLVNTDKGLLAPANEHNAGAETENYLVRLMLKGAREGEPGDRESTEAAERQWLAVVNERHLSLTRIGSSGPLRLDAYLGRMSETGMLFLYVSHGMGIEARLPPGFRIERSDGGVMVWPEDSRAESIENGLVRLGRILFS